ncbi:NAD-dependent succinate-semialdehyde dehydrogenase [Leptolyngbya valderiana BDU 20041]|nr:NAD-dependent succinate-semialdehyde dehydrogenase [Leptolyngbya valderiana BDU 20041]
MSLQNNPKSENLINGSWVGADSGKTIDVLDPATDEKLASIPDAGGAEATRAIDAAHEAFGPWSKRTAADRGKLVGRLAELMHRDADRLAALMTAEQGKPLSEAKGEINYAASFLEWAAGEAPRMYGEMVPASSNDKRILVMRQPVGVCGIITPWNFPAAMITRKIGPALAAGCTVVIKPAELTPLSAIAIGELAIEAGLPAGTVNIVTGNSKAVAKPMFEDGRVRKLSFTGSTPVGQILMKQASENLLRLSMELGGHAPFIVFDDADLERSVNAAVACKFRNAGQTCICANRFYVQSGIYDAFMDRFAKAVEKLKVGRGTQDGVDIGPLINDKAIEKVQEHVDDARSKGATIKVGGEMVKLDGLANRFYAPTLIDGMTPDMKCASEETFGPVAPVAKFEKDQEAIDAANNTPYGLASYFFTSDATRLMRTAEALEYGIVGANDAAPSTAQAPFGGVKHSGFGREGGKYVMEEYTNLKYVSWGLV